MNRLAICASLALAFSASQLGAASITIYNTGVDDSNVVLAAGATDTHYVQIAPSASTFVLSSTPGVWLANDASSQWIGPDTFDGNGAYTLTYRTTFDLTGLDSLTALLNGRWSVDNTGLSILLNGVDTGSPSSPGFGGFTAFSINSGFVSGLNTLDFVWNNAGGPGGLRVEVSGTAADASGVPEPASIAFVGAGIAAVWFARRRRAA